MRLKNAHRAVLHCDHIIGMNDLKHIRRYFQRGQRFPNNPLVPDKHDVRLILAFGKDRALYQLFCRPICPHNV